MEQNALLFDCGVAHYVESDGSGRRSWIGNPVPRNSIGPGGGTVFSRTLPTGSAVSGLRGPSSNDVDAIDLEYRKLGAGAVATGNPSYLGAVDGTGGLARSACRCGTNNLAYALYGRTGTTLRGFGFRCRRPAV